MDSDNPLSGSSEADFVPKVFVSYSWAGKARAKRIADFLRTECGVDVVIDIYHLKPGQNKYAFMQRIVDDASIDRVLVLCDQAYQERANNFEGGVGDEATIISPKIYKDAKQTKFLPVVMEKDDEGNPYIPTFADGRIYLAHRSHSWLWYNRVMQGDFEYVGLGFVSNDHLAVLPFIPMDTKVRMLSHAILGGGRAGNATAAALGRRACSRRIGIHRPVPFCRLRQCSVRRSHLNPTDRQERTAP